MPDLYAINLHLQQRLELDWREEVRAVEAARWLDKAGLLPDRKGGLPLRNLLRAGRIAGQQQRPDKKNGMWFIRRLATSRDPDAIRDARERLRRCLPIDRDALPPGWPVNQEPAVFWQELGKTVAAFGYLEHILASTCYAFLSTGERAVALLKADDHEAMRQWTKRLLRARTDSLRALMGGTGYALATVMPRMYAPRSAPPEPDLLHAARRTAERDNAHSREMLTRRLAALDIGGIAPTEPE